MPLPLVVDDNTQTGVALSAYRKRLAEELGFFDTYTATATSAAVESTRMVLASALRSDAAQPNMLDGLFCYVTSGPQAGVQRRVMNGSYAGPDGAFAVDHEYDALLGSGVTFELSVMPATTYLGVTGLNQCINEGLELLPLLDYVQVTAVANQSEYPFSNYAWPIKSIHDVVYSRQSTTNEQRRSVPRSSWSFNQDGNAPILSFWNAPATAGDTFEVGLLRPAHTLVKSGGVWADSVVGLVNDSDQALYDVLTVVRVAKPIALARFAKVFPEGSKERAAYEAEADRETVRGAAAKWFGAFRGNGRQRVGAGYGSRQNTWWANK